MSGVEVVTGEDGGRFVAIEGTFIPTADVREAFMAGSSIEEICESYKELDPPVAAQEVQAALRYECCATCSCDDCGWARTICADADGTADEERASSEVRRQKLAAKLAAIWAPDLVLDLVHRASGESVMRREVTEMDTPIQAATTIMEWASSFLASRSDSHPLEVFDVAAGQVVITLWVYRDSGVVLSGGGVPKPDAADLSGEVQAAMVDAQGVEPT